MVETQKEDTVRDSLGIFKSKICLMFVIVFCLSLSLLYLPNLAIDLMASSQNILGVVTGIFVNKDFGYLIGNFLLAFITLLFYFVSSTISGIRNDKFLAMGIWFSAILANFAYVFISPYSRVGGSSGLVSAFLGGVVVLAYVSAYIEPVRSSKIIQSIIGSFLFTIFIILNLNTASDINVPVHLMSFSVMAFLSLLKTHQFVKKYGKKIKRKE